MLWFAPVDHRVFLRNRCFNYWGVFYRHIDNCVRLRNDYKGLELGFLEHLAVLQRGEVRLLLSRLLGRIKVEQLILVNKVEAVFLI